MIRSHLLAASLLLAPAAPGCAADDEPCSMAAAFCDEDGRAHLCEEGEEGGTVETILECGEDGRQPVCVVTAAGAACLASDQPVAACAGAPIYSHVCDGTDEVVCLGGYAWARESCAACEPDDLDAGEIRCVGGLLQACEADDDCAADLSCVPGELLSVCSKSCGCPDGLCDECDTTSSPGVCRGGTCASR